MQEIVYLIGEFWKKSNKAKGNTSWEREFAQEKINDNFILKDNNILTK
jgi:hypothetical protein